MLNNDQKDLFKFQLLKMFFHHFLKFYNTNVYKIILIFSHILIYLVILVYLILTIPVQIPFLTLYLYQLKVSKAV